MSKFIDKLTWDSEYFGINVAKTNLQSGINSYIEEIMDSVKKNNINLLYHYQNPSIKDDISDLEADGFNLVDEKITLCMDIKKKSTQNGFDNVWEYSDAAADIQDLYDISSEISKLSRYSYDKNISEEKCTELYKLWIYNGIYKNFCDKTFVYKLNNKVVGFIMLKIDYELKTANISLIGVGENYRHKGIGAILIQKALDYLKNNNIETFYVDTQLRNIGALNLYISNGFKIYETTLTYHLWSK